MKQRLRKYKIQLNYFCTKHRVKSTNNNKFICNAKIVYNRKEKIFILFILIQKNVMILVKLYLIILKISKKKLINYGYFKNILITYLNNNPIINYKTFNKYAQTYFLEKKKFSFNLKANTIKNIFYSWKSTNNIFKWPMIFDNDKTLDGNIFMKNQVYKILYDDKNDKNIKHMYINYISDFFINILRNINHIYVDGTFICPNNFAQMLIVLGYDPIVEKKYPLSFILINNKNQLGYECTLKNFKDIITLGNKSKINIISYTTDFENALINAMKKNFSSCRGIGCLFHYSQALMRNIKSLGLYIKKNIN